MLLALTAVPQFAGILEFVSIQNGTTFVYDAKLQNNQYIDDGEYFVIFDFSGLQTGTGPSGWTFSQTNNADGAVNDALTPDAIFTYAGPRIAGAQPNTLIGQFTVTGTLTESVEGVYLSRTRRQQGGNADIPVTQTGLVLVPTAGQDEAPVPEPAAMLLTAAGISTLALGRRLMVAKR